MLGNILVHASLTEVIMWSVFAIVIAIGCALVIYDVARTKFRQFKKRFLRT